VRSSITNSRFSTSGAMISQGAVSWRSFLLGVCHFARRCLMPLISAGA
jgi:hypothetical protein